MVVTSSGRPALDLAGEGQRGPADVGEAVGGLDAHVDVHAPAARGLRPAGGAELVEHLVDDPGHPAHRRRRALGHRVEVDAPLVGLLGVGPPGVPRVELDGRHLHRPDHLGQLGHAQLVGVLPVAGEVDAHGLEPGRGPARHPLLVDLLLGHALGEPVQHARPLAQGVDDARPDRQVVLDQVELGRPRAGK